MCWKKWSSKKSPFLGILSFSMWVVILARNGPFLHYRQHKCDCGSQSKSHMSWTFSSHKVLALGYRTITQWTLHDTYFANKALFNKKMGENRRNTHFVHFLDFSWIFMKLAKNLNWCSKLSRWKFFWEKILLYCFIFFEVLTKGFQLMIIRRYLDKNSWFYVNLKVGVLHKKKAVC